MGIGDDYSDVESASIARGLWNDLTDRLKTASHLYQTKVEDPALNWLGKKTTPGGEMLMRSAASGLHGDVGASPGGQLERYSDTDRGRRGLSDLQSVLGETGTAAALFGAQQLPAYLVGRGAQAAGAANRALQTRKYNALLQANAKAKTVAFPELMAESGEAREAAMQRAMKWLDEERSARDAARATEVVDFPGPQMEPAEILRDRQARNAARLKVSDPNKTGK